MSVGMSEFKSAAPYKLSGGQKQRVAIAGVLAMEPECIVLDEPTAMLDPIGRKEVIKAITQLNQEKGITVIMISHDMQSAMKYATNILHLDRSLLFYGRKDEYLLSVHSKKLLM